MSKTLLIGFAVALVFLLIFSRMLRVIAQRYHQVLTLLFAVFGGLFVLSEYWDAQEEGKLKQTLSYVQRVQSGDVAEARRWFDLFWFNNAEKVEQFHAAGRAGNEQEAAAALEALESAAQADANGQQNIMRMFYFYADLATCSNLGICDQKTACSIFKKDIGNHYFFFSDFIEKWTQISFSGKMDEIIKFNEAC